MPHQQLIGEVTRNIRPLETAITRILMRNTNSAMERLINCGFYPVNPEIQLILDPQECKLEVGHGLNSKRFGLYV